MRVTLIKLRHNYMSLKLRFERKNGTVNLTASDSGYVITTAQRIRMDLVWVTESVRHDVKDAMALYLAHKDTILNNGHCVGDNAHLR